MVLKNGITGICQYCALGSLLKREKSGMLTARVLYPPVMLVMLDSQSQALSAPCTEAGRVKNVPLPPALTATHTVIPIATGGNNTVFTQNMYCSLCVGMRRNGNWMSQYKKYEIIPAVVRPTDAGR